MSVLTFQALQLANEQRNAYGLRYNDFTRYRKHCANRTHRLRSTLKTTHGQGREFKKLPRTSPENLKDGHLQLLLFEAERAWAYSQELIASSLQPANEDKASSLRHSATGRFRRSVHWSTQLLSHCQTLFASSRLSAESLLQATVYTLILNGRFLRYRDDLEDGLIQLSVARGLLDALAAAASTSRAQALATLFSDEIGPEIRYCAHELGRAKAYDVDAIVQDVAAKHRNEIVEGCDALVAALKTEAGARGSGEVRQRLRAWAWEGRPVPVRNPELVDVLLKVQDAEDRLDGRGDADKGGVKVAHAKGSKKGVAAYDAILSALSDAEDVGRKLVEAQQLSGTSAGASSAGTRDIHFVHAYIVYQLLSRRIQRDLLLISALISSEESSKPRPTTAKTGSTSTLKPKPEKVDARLFPAVIKLLDTVLQSLNQMRTLTIVDDSPDLASAVDARLSLTKAHRCFYLARSYAPLKKYAQALTLIQHGNLHLRETRSITSTSDTDPITSGDPSYYPLTTASLNKLEGDLVATGLSLKKDWFAFNGGSIDADNTSYKKPLFFNIALNYVQLDMDRLQQRAGKAPAPTPAPTSAPASQAVPTPEKKQASKTRIEEVRSATPEPQAPARSGLSSLLGGWWGKS